LKPHGPPLKTRALNCRIKASANANTGFVRRTSLEAGQGAV